MAWSVECQNLVRVCPKLNHVQIQSLEELRKGGSYWRCKGGHTEEWLTEQGFSNLHPSVNHQQNIHRLRSGRLDLIAYESQGSSIYYGKKGCRHHVKSVFNLKTSDVYSLMSKIPYYSKLMQSWKTAAEKFRRSGQQQFIAEKWQMILKHYHNINTEAVEGVLYFE